MSGDGKVHVLLNAKINEAESEQLEFKNFDFRNIPDNTRKLEEVITGMLNRERYDEIDNQQQVEDGGLSGRIFLGVKDSTR